MVDTAYTGVAASEYDSWRFTSPNGKAYDELESELVLRGLEGIPASSSVLEVGCGTGRFLLTLAKRGYRVTGAEPSAEMIELTQAKFAEDEAPTVVQAEGADLPFADDEFDVVYSVRVLNQIASEAYAYRMLDEMIRVTRPGGRTLIEFANRARPTAFNDAVRLSPRAIGQYLRERGDVTVLWQCGLLFFSERALQMVPAPLLPAWKGLERIVAARLPGASSRCFMLLEKHS